MTILGYKRLAILLGVACVGFLVLSGFLFWNYGWLKIQVAFAGEQTTVFDEMRSRAAQSDTAEATDCLQYVVGYYPSGTKQETGSRLDRIVERERAIAVQDIISHLRAKTTNDLGGDPTVWIQKYGKK